MRASLRIAAAVAAVSVWTPLQALARQQAAAQPVAPQAGSTDGRDAAAQAVKAEVERLRQEFEAVKQQYGERLAALEARLAALDAGRAAPSPAGAPPEPRRRGDPPGTGAGDRGRPPAQRAPAARRGRCRSTATRPRSRRSSIPTSP